MDDIAEQQEVAREISDAISNPLAFGQDVDDDELEKELEELEQQALDEELLKVGPVTNDLPVTPEQLPNVPAGSRQPGKLIGPNHNLIILFATMINPFFLNTSYQNEIQVGHNREIILS